MNRAQPDQQELILRATCKVIAEQGFRAMRVSDVAEVHGSASGTIYYYFATKRNLLHAAFEYNFRHSLERRREIFESSTDPVTKLRRFVDSYVPEGDETLQAWRMWAELWIEGIHDPDLQELNEAVYGEWRTVIAQIIREGHERGLFVAGDAVVQAEMLIALIDGLAIQLVMRSRRMRADRMRAICHAFLDSTLLR